MISLGINELLGVHVDRKLIGVFPALLTGNDMPTLDAQHKPTMLSQTMLQNSNSDFRVATAQEAVFKIDKLQTKITTISIYMCLIRGLKKAHYFNREKFDAYSESKL